MSTIMGPTARRSAWTGVLTVLASIPFAGCAPKRVAVDMFPPGTISVRYVPAGDLTDCLVASTTMAANYVLNTDRFTPSGIRTDLNAAGLDHTRVADMQSWAENNGMQMVAIRGDLTRLPPLGLLWWVLDRGYPVICVINKYAGNPEYNHAVLVIGLDLGKNANRAEGVYVLDPASPKRLVRWDRLTFAHFWGSARRVMLPLFEAPARGAQPQGEPGAMP